MRRAAHALRRRDSAYYWGARLLAVTFVPVAGRHLACQWALGLRFPAEDLDGLTPATRAAFEAARADAFWGHGRLLGLTSGYRRPEHQARLYEESLRDGSKVVLPPEQSRHVAGTAVDVRPMDGARWLERHGERYGLYRVYDDEWWHFEYRPQGRPARLPHPVVRSCSGRIAAWAR